MAVRRTGLLLLLLGCFSLTVAAQFPNNYHPELPPPFWPNLGCRLDVQSHCSLCVPQVGEYNLCDHYGFERRIFGGHFDMSLSVDPSEANFVDALDFATELNTTIALGSATIASVIKMSETSTDEMSFAFSALAGLWYLTSDMYFDIAPPSFKYLRAATSAQMFGVSVQSLLILVRNPSDPTPSDLGLTLDFIRETWISRAERTMWTTHVSIGLGTYDSVYGNTGDTDGICDLPFRDATISLTGPFLCCDTTGRLTAAFDCQGFDYFEISTELPPFGGFEWLRITPTLRYELQQKTISLTASVSLDYSINKQDPLCQLVFNAAFQGTTGEQMMILDGLQITNFQFLCQVLEMAPYGGGGLIFIADSSSWQLRTQLPYLIQTGPILGSVDALPSCGEYSFDFSVVFDENSAQLFDVSVFEANLQLTFYSGYLWTVGFDFNLDQSTTTFEIGLKTVW